MYLLGKRFLLHYTSGPAEPRTRYQMGPAPPSISEGTQASLESTTEGRYRLRIRNHTEDRGSGLFTPKWQPMILLPILPGTFSDGTNWPKRRNWSWAGASTPEPSGSSTPQNDSEALHFSRSAH